MKKLSSRTRWSIIAAVLIALAAFFFIKVDSVMATFSNVHALMVMLRVETEIMQKTPAGQYYESLFWKHNDEIMRISAAHPEKDEELWRVTRLFIPGLEALLDGEGDSVFVTAEQVEGLNGYLDWLVSVASPALQADIQMEQQRLMLDHFVGMTMNEALDFINLTWMPDAQISRDLVPGSDGKWAYTVYNGVYFEYPASYGWQASESDRDIIYFMPSTGSPEAWHPCVMKVQVWTLPAAEKDSATPLSWYPVENIAWQSEVQFAEFQGLEFISTAAGNPVMDMHAFLYNPDTQTAVDIWVFVNENPPLAEGEDYAGRVGQRYEYFQHMVDAIKLQTP